MSGSYSDSDCRPMQPQLNGIQHLWSAGAERKDRRPFGWTNGLVYFEAPHSKAGSQRFFQTWRFEAAHARRRLTFRSRRLLQAFLSVV